MNYAPATVMSYQYAGTTAHEQISEYLETMGANLTPVKYVRLLHDYASTFKAIYPENQAECIAQRLLHYAVSELHRSLGQEDGELELSMIPKITLQYRYVDSSTMVYRIVYMDKVKIDPWTTVKGQRGPGYAARHALLTILRVLNIEEWIEIVREW